MRPWIPSLFLFALIACDKDQPVDTGEPVIVTDEDGDGHDAQVHGGDDCDDSNAAVFPGADEVCDGIDNNCDGSTDGEDSSDALTFYADSDGDGYGVETDTVLACAEPSGYASLAGDCDDSEGAAFPGNDEVCDSIDNNCNAQVDEPTAVDAPTWYTDNDQDGYGDPNYSTASCTQPSGYVDNALDCDDVFDSINPDAEEYCDGIDNNCDTVIDEDTSVDAPVWYIDNDSDGYGSGDSTAIACSQPSGYAGTADDCDDSDASVSPAGLEVCGDGVDNDCSGDADGSDASDAIVQYADGDGDGYGDDTTATTGCDFAAGTTWVSVGGDCDDAASGVNPGALEVCDGSVDENCDGSIDEATASDAATWYLDSDSDGYGDASNTTPACSQPSGYVADSSDCDDSSGDISPAAEEVCENSTDDDCDGVLDECAIQDDLSMADAEAVYSGSANYDYAGAAVALADWDGDGNAEIFVGANYNDDGAANSGAVFMWYGPSSGSATGSAADLEFMGDSSASRTGEAIAMLADQDLDGFGELAIGAPGYDDLDADAGAVYLVTGQVTADMDLADAIMLAGSYAQGNFGVSLSVGDVDNDGYDDLMVGAPSYSYGYAYVFHGPITSDAFDSDAGTTITGAVYGDTLGTAVSTGGDVDGDGIHDMLVGAPSADSDAGAAYLFYGSSTSSAADVTFSGAAGDKAGSALSVLGDLNSDGYSDMVIGAPSSTNGTAYVVFGPITSDVDLSTAADMTFTGDASGDQAGAAFNLADFDGDGDHDLVLGAPYTDTSNSNSGTAYLFYGPFTAGTVAVTSSDAAFTGTSSNAHAGESLASGDSDGDGYDDLLIGASRETISYRIEGAASLLLGDQR